MSRTYIKSLLTLIGQTIWIEEGHLYARTSIWYLLACLFFYSKTVIINKDRRYIEICVKYFWFIKSQSYIHFDEIESIDKTQRVFDDSEENPFDLPLSFWNNELRQIDNMRLNYVQIRIKSSPIPINLFGISGSAAHCALLVSQLTGIILWEDRNIEYISKPLPKYKCTNCNHIYSSKNGKCFYCGHFGKLVIGAN